MSKILIAEGDEAMREFITQVLLRQGQTVKAVSTGAEALKTFGGYDLLLSDIHMPGVDGVSLAHCVARDHPNLAIHFVTGYASEVKRGSEFDCVRLEVLPKPFTLVELVRRSYARVLTGLNPCSKALRPSAVCDA